MESVGLPNLDPLRLSRSGIRFAQSAMERLLAEEDDAFVLHAATAVEHLAKAILAGVHPALIADSRSFDALLFATGRQELADPGKLRTVSGSDAMERVKRFVPALREMDEAMRLLQEARNGVAHIGLPHAGWQRSVVPFLRAVELLAAEPSIARAEIWGAALERVDARLAKDADEVRGRVLDAIARARAKLPASCASENWARTRATETGRDQARRGARCRRRDPA